MSGPVLTFGEALLRLSPPEHTPLTSADQLQLHIGGAELNVAAALSRLGLPSRFASALPDNPLGERVVRHLLSCGVQPEPLWVQGGRLGSYYLESAAPPRGSRVTYDRAASAFAQLSLSDLTPQRLSLWLSGVRWLHLSGISLAVSEGARQAALHLMAEARARGIPVSFDVNHRRLLLPDAQAAAVYGPALSLAQVVVVAARDLPLLLGQDPAELDVMLTQLRARVPQAALLISQGEQGSLLALPDGRRVHCGIFAAQGPGRVGRGDAFCGAFLAGWLELGERPQEQPTEVLEAVLRFATAAAALKTTEPGDALLSSRAEVQALADQARVGPSALRLTAASEPRR